MEVGQNHKSRVEITPQLVADFAKCSGDFNPIHLDAEFASRTVFKKPIAHGMLGMSLLSGAMGTKFPGPGTILMEQSMKFMKPIYVGDTVTLEIFVEHVREDKPIVTLLCRILNRAEEITSEGKIIVRAPKGV